MNQSALKKILKEKKDKIFLINSSSQGNIPVVAASGLSLAEAWENAMIGLYAHGCKIHTQYDAKNKRGDYIDPPSKDCTIIMTIEHPSSEPMIHMGGIPGGFVEEFCQGRAIKSRARHQFRQERCT